MNWKKRIDWFIKKDSNKKIVFFINLRDRLDKLANFFREYLQDKSMPYLIVFLNNSDIPKQFAQLNLNMKLSEDYLSSEDYQAIDSYIFEGISKNWYLYKNITDYEGVHLGKMFEYDFQKYLIPRIKNLEVIQKIVRKEDIQKIIILEDAGELGEVARIYADSVNLPILAISFNRSKKLSFRLNSKIRAKLSIFLSCLLDKFAFKKIMKINSDKGLILIDAKLYKYFKHKENEIPFFQCLLEEGLRIRFNILRKKSSYLPFYFRKNRYYFKEYFEYIKKWKELYPDENFKGIFKYKDISIWGVVNQRLRNFFLENIPRIISNINFLNIMLKEKKIKMVVLRNDVKELERTVILGSRLKKIPALVIQHGILAETNGHNALLADKFAAWGRASLDWYGRFGNSFEKFEITGNPCFDVLLNWKPKISRHLLCRQLNLDVNKGIILFATQQINKFSSFWTDDLFWVMADRLLAAIQQFPDKQLIIKVDPYEDLHPYLDRISVSSYNNAIAIKGIDIYTLIFLSDLVITLDSTVGLEAMIFDKPIITINFTKRQDRVPYAEKGAAIGVYKEEDLIPVLKKTLTDQEIVSRLKINRNKFLEEYAYRIDGKSEERILTLIKQSIRN